MTSGIDLVAWQLRIAAGASIAALKPAHDGHAMNFASTRKTRSLGFAPFPGRITALRAPSGPGIRFDTGVQTGSDCLRPFRFHARQTHCARHHARGIA